jgi:formylglycine-generating enzyme required for sulfatase activity
VWENQGKRPEFGPGTEELLMSLRRLLLALFLLAAVSPLFPSPAAPVPATPESTKAFTNALGMKMVRIPAGKFLRGSETGELFEKPVREIEVSAFFLGETEVTQKQFRDVMGYNPSFYSNHARGQEGATYNKEGWKPGGGAVKVKGQDTESFPVDNVSWDEAKEFCRKLNVMDKKKPSGWDYRLPREAEWEYACRAGTTTNYHSGDGENDLKKVGWYKENSANQPHAVGGKEKNAFGLCDMHGNVWEWCEDWFQARSYSEGATRDPVGPAAGTRRVARGGCWIGTPNFCRSGLRGLYEPNSRICYLGFRIALAPSPGK